MDIFLSINNREQVIMLPVIPKEFLIKSPYKNEGFESVSQGELKLIGLRGLKSMTISSFFPQQEYPFTRDDTYKAWEYIEMIENWRERRIPIRLVITDTPINMAVVIENFEYGIKDGTGDIYYTLTLSEFKFITVRRV